MKTPRTHRCLRRRFPSSLDVLRSAVGQAALTGAGVHAVNATQYPTLSAWTR